MRQALVVSAAFVAHFKATNTRNLGRMGTRLTFEGLHDTCVGRRVVLGGTFTRVA